MNAVLMRMMRMTCGAGALAATCFWLTAATAQTATSQMVSAANTFLSTLDDKQRQSVLFPFDDEQSGLVGPTSRQPSFLGEGSA